MLKYFKLSVWVRIAAGTRRSPQVRWCEGGWEKGFLTEKSQETGQTEKTQGLQCPETNNFRAVTSTRLKQRRCISYGHRSERKRGMGWLTGKMALGQEARPVRDNPWLHCSPFPVSSWHSPLARFTSKPGNKYLDVGCTGQLPRCHGPDVCPHPNSYVKP